MPSSMASLAGIIYVLGNVLPPLPAPADEQQLPRISLNDNTAPAGTLNDGVLTLELEIRRGSWHVLGDDHPATDMLAFAERGRAPTNPGPMIRVTRGTVVHVRVTNPLDTTVVVRGFGERRTRALEPLRIPAGATREVRFVADAAGTYFYWGSIDAPVLSNRRYEDSQLTGAFIVDEPGAVVDDRVFVIGMWFDGRLPDGSPDFSREFLTINGRPWPDTERLSYALGDSIRWRIINASSDFHAMHLHGFYYRIDAKGDIARDTVFWESGRRVAVTERVAPGSTMSLVWSPDRPGGWIFHCHMSVHVIPNPALGPAAPGGDARFDPLFRDGHAHGDPDDHAEQAMGGLVMSVYVRPPPGWAPNEPKRREMRLYIQSVEAEHSLSGRQFSYVLQEGAQPPAADSVVFPASTLVLRKGEPTSIRVFNRTDEASQVHWHGLEIESYFDGVAGGSGYPGNRTPAIAPGDSFEIRITPPRAGSFMYHTHMNDLRQQGSGLYGAFVVLEPDETWDPETDRVVLFGESPFRDDEVPVLNGANPPPPLTLHAGTTYRFRFMQITLNRPNTRVRLVRNGFPVRWIPIAKDGFDRPPTQRAPQLADQFIAVGETYDFALTPPAPGELTLELRTGNGVLLIAQTVRIMK